MGVTKTVIAEGSGASPQKGDRVTMEYTGWLRTAGKPEEKGKQFDSTTGRGPFQTPIGVGRVIKGEFVSDENYDGIISDNHGQAGTRVLCR
jgi:FK506-binding protein 1